MRRMALSVIVIATSLALVRAQSPAPPGARLAFDVASIKRSSPDARGGRIGQQPGGRWVMANVVIAALIRSAYPTKVSELAGAPDWVNDDRYDVTAKAEGNPTPEQMSIMLQTLLTERFKLVAHYETRDQPVFALVVARSDGRLGPGLLVSKVDCDAVNAARRAGRAPEGPTPANGAPLCGYSVSGDTVKFGGLPISRFADYLGNNAGRVVMDKTGLTGNYEFTLRSTTDPTPNPADDVPSLFSALQDQLGLKLVPDRAPLQMLVIDHIERPTED